MSAAYIFMCWAALALGILCIVIHAWLCDEQLKNKQLRKDNNALRAELDRRNRIAGIAAADLPAFLQRQAE